ncbi:cytochrome P450 [Lactarius akahatsu]|uniref:Cytochrome P450 n=1 Tax=Lactarius akahatsu TaxID=416441 RepID=A0AAD4LKD0_9AGAM|nr:cytochrome P450 [Lactarius akahatsu]
MKRAGHWRHMFNPYAFSFHEELFRTYGTVARVYGFLGDIQLVVSDPKACNNIFIKDQLIFEQTEAQSFPKSSSVLAKFVTYLGVHHRRQRKLLNPLFNVNHLRHMIPIFHRVARKLRGNLELIVLDGPQEINIADWIGRFALELIGEAGLGYSFGTLEGRNDEYCRALNDLTCFPGQLCPLLRFIETCFLTSTRSSIPQFSKLVGRMLPWPKLNHLMDISETMNAGARRIYEAKKRLLELGDDATIKQVGDGKDILGLLMQTCAAESENDRPSEEEVLAHMTLLVFSATDTTSSALSRILHLLALYPDTQDKLRKELKEACEENEELTHDQLVSLPFLEAVCRETLRLYPPGSGVMRTARSDVVLPLSSPIHDIDGREIHEIFVPKNTNLFIQIYNLNRDPSIWGSDAAEWKPERWLAPLPESVANANIQGVYANTMTFIGGPRSCIGFKFSQLEMKVALSLIIPTFRFTPAEVDVVWRFGVIVNPSVKGSVESFLPQLPMVVSRSIGAP